MKRGGAMSSSEPVRDWCVSEGGPRLRPRTESLMGVGQIVALLVTDLSRPGPPLPPVLRSCGAMAVSMARPLSSPLDNGAR